MIETNAPLSNCGSQSEFVEKAVRFYDGYLRVQNAGAFLPTQWPMYWRVRWECSQTAWQSCCST